MSDETNRPYRQMWHMSWKSSAPPVFQINLSHPLYLLLLTTLSSLQYTHVDRHVSVLSLASSDILISIPILKNLVLSAEVGASLIIYSASLAEEKICLFVICKVQPRCPADHQRSLSGNKGKYKLWQRMYVLAGTVLFFLCFGLI